MMSTSKSLLQLLLPGSSRIAFLMTQVKKNEFVLLTTGRRRKEIYYRRMSDVNEARRVAAQPKEDVLVHVNVVIARQASKTSQRDFVGRRRKLSLLPSSHDACLVVALIHGSVLGWCNCMQQHIPRLLPSLLRWFVDVDIKITLRDFSTTTRVRAKHPSSFLQTKKEPKKTTRCLNSGMPVCAIAARVDVAFACTPPVALALPTRRWPTTSRRLANPPTDGSIVSLPTPWVLVAVS